MTKWTYAPSDDFLLKRQKAIGARNKPFTLVPEYRPGGGIVITIFKNKKDIPHDMEYVELNDIYFNQSTSLLLDEKAEKIIETIDGATLIGRFRIRSKFNGIVVDIDKLSTSCKTVLNVLYNPDKVFCLKECGNKALEMLFAFETGNVYSDYTIIPFEMNAVRVQTSSEKKEIDDYEELKEWWSYEE